MPAPIKDREQRVVAAIKALGRPTVQAIADHAGFSKSTANRVLRDMEAAGKLRRTPSLYGPNFYEVS